MQLFIKVNNSGLRVGWLGRIECESEVCGIRVKAVADR